MNFFTKTEKKNKGKFEAGQEDERGRQDKIDGLELVTGDWVDWLKDCSAKKHKVPVGTASARNMMRAANESEPSDTSLEADSSRTSFQSTQEPREMSNLENIIRNFEIGYLPPSKKDRATNEYKQKNFVKKIVETFEVKYKIYNESKSAREIPESPEENKSNAPMLESWKKKLCNPFKNDSSHSKRNSRDVDECDGSAFSPEEKILHASWENNRITRRRLRELENSKSSVKSKLILSAFGRKASGLELCSTFLRSNSDSSSSSNCFTRAEMMRKVEFSNLVKRFSRDKTKTMGSIEPYMTSSDENIFTPNNSLPTASTLIESPRSDNSMLSEISHVDRSPKVIGAFLKKPIDVENTFVDWVPITGKRLPRKKSLKKLLCSFTKRKLVKRSSSENNLSEEPREIQDSEYDEKSSSSISITSLIPIADVLRHQENNYFEFDRRSELKTFKSKDKSNEEKGEALCDTYHSAEKQKGKTKLILTEVPREEVKLDLGPSYPSLSQTIRFFSPLVNKLAPRPAERLCVSKIPKNPFVTWTKIDNLAEFNDSPVYHNTNVLSSTIMIKNNLYEVEFRRSCSDLPSSNVYSSSSSVTSPYDVPRRFLSKSENEILWMWKSKLKLNRKEEPIYDIPKSQSIERPRSSIYDDVLSLKKNGIYEGAKTNLNTRFLAQRDLESHHVITRPIDTRIYSNTQVQSTSFNDLVSDV